MRAFFGGSGLNLTLLLKDKEEGNKKRKLECRLPQWKKARVVLHIVDKINEKAKEKGFMEESWFHILASPRHKSPEYRYRYNIYLIKEAFDKLTNPKEDPVVKGGIL